MSLAILFLGTINNQNGESENVEIFRQRFARKYTAHFGERLALFCLTQF